MMRVLRLECLLLVGLLILSSCSGSRSMTTGNGLTDPGEKGSFNHESGNYIVSLHITGGFAGRDEVLLLQDDGLIRYTNIRSGVTRERWLSADRQEKIKALVIGLEGTGSDKSGRRASSRCRDCLDFELVLDISGKPRVIKLASDRLSDSPHRELIGVMTAIISELQNDGS